MFLKFLAIIVLLVALVLLGRGLTTWLRHKQGAEVATARAMTWRVAVSLGLFILLFLVHIFSHVN